MRHHKRPPNGNGKFVAWLRREQKKRDPPLTPPQQKTRKWLEQKLQLPQTATSAEILAEFLARFQNQFPENRGSVDGADEHYYWRFSKELGWTMILDLHGLNVVSAREHLTTLQLLGMGSVVVVIHGYHGGTTLKGLVTSFFSRARCAIPSWNKGMTVVDLTNLPQVSG